MIILPEKFKKSIINRYYEEGIKWLNDVDKLIEKYVEKYELENIRLVDNLSINLVLFAKSRRYGDVVLKIVPAHKTGISEVSAIQQYPSKYAPICYHYDKEDEVIILELLSPGTSLLTVDNLEERIKIFSNLANNIMFETENKDNFKTYKKRFNDKIICSRQNKEEFLDIANIINTSIQFYKELEEKNLPKYVLHGDLKHSNILKSGDNWKAIDPHGIIGERAFETAPFILNEFKHYNIKIEELDNIILLISKYFKEDKKLIEKALFITIVEKIIWQRHSQYDENLISTYIDICNYLLQIKLQYIS